MNIYDIDKLKKNPDGSYDLTQLTFNSRSDVEFFSYTVQSGEEMRMDLVCQSIYGDVEFIDVIMHINNIDNPLNIKEGTTIKYPPSNKLQLFRIEEEKKDDVQKKLANPNKSTRKDNNRKKYIEQGYSLPPVVLEKPVDPVRVTDDGISIGGVSF